MPLADFKAIQATIPRKGQINNPIGIRNKLGRVPGVILEVAEAPPYLEAVPAFDEEQMRSVLGWAQTQF